jgi:hypothetical protein
MADANSGHRVPYMFLDDVRTKFLSQFGRSFTNAREGGLDDAFSRTIREQMARQPSPHHRRRRRHHLAPPTMSLC